MAIAISVGIHLWNYDQSSLYATINVICRLLLLWLVFKFGWLILILYITATVTVQCCPVVDYTNSLVVSSKWLYKLLSLKTQSVWVVGAELLWTYCFSSENKRSIQTDCYDWPRSELKSYSHLREKLTAPKFLDHGDDELVGYLHWEPAAIDSTPLERMDGALWHFI